MIDLLVIGACIVPFVMLKRKIFRKRDKQDGGIITNSASTLDGKTAYVEPKGFDNTSNNCKHKNCPKYTVQHSCPKDCDKTYYKPVVRIDEQQAIKDYILDNENIKKSFEDSGLEFWLTIGNEPLRFKANRGKVCPDCILESGINRQTHLVFAYSFDKTSFGKVDWYLCPTHGWIK